MKKNIERCISECKYELFTNLFIFFGFGGIACFFLSLIFGFWSWGIPIGIVFGFLVALSRDCTVYFTFQDTTTDLNLFEVTRSTSKLSYITLRIVGDSDDGMVICKVDHIDGKLIDGVVLKIPKSEIFKKPRCFWQIKFKPIG